MMREYMKSILGSRKLPWMAGLLAVTLALPSLWGGPIVDDFVQQALLQKAPFAVEHFGSPFAMYDFTNGDQVRTRELKDIGFMPWWTWEGSCFSFLRPVAVLTHLLDYRLWPMRYPLMHVHSLLWFGALVVAAGILYRKFLGVGWAAGLAALLYAVDEAHAIPAGWLAARNGLVAGVFGILALLLHHAWRRAGENTQAPVPRVWALPLALACLLLSVLSNEGGIAVCAYLFAYAVVLERGPLRTRLLTLAPYALVIVLWRIAYTTLGYGVRGSDLYIDPIVSPVQFAQALAMRMPVQFLAQWFIPSSMPFTFLPWTAQITLSGLGVLAALWLARVVIPVLRADRTARFWAVGMVLALIPACTAFPQERLLIFVGLGAMGILAQFLEAASQGGLEALTPLRRASARTLRAVLIAAHLVVAPILLPLVIVGFFAFGRPLTNCIENTPLRDDIADKTVVAVNTPTIYFTSFLPLARSMQGKALPARLRNLSPNTPIQGRTILTRSDPHTLVVRPDTGFPWYLVRNHDHPFVIGEHVELAGMTIEIRELMPNAWPQEVAFRFDVPLEHPSLVWFEVKKDHFVPFTPPKVGHTIVLTP